eukprot:TRINITY_DN15109_c0_g1_i1.p1 TRINITY_DN15109_c0_g1~~TRINITY_DN15109_c0_g1_i1.p1  ORF type:complete len:392 (-),score=96.84 TRINITY_DN15109_c0_g1_i1:22-1197(-)
MQKVMGGGLESYVRDEDEEEKKKVQTWEGAYIGAWTEDPNVQTEEEKRLEEEKKRKREARAVKKIRRGMTRHLFLVIDQSKGAGQTDLKPNRHAVITKFAEAFIGDFFDQNPLSQMGLIITRNSVADKLTELSATPQKHITALKAQPTFEGEASLQNALEVAKSTLCFVPKYGTREILLLSSSLSTCDPGDIFATLESLKKENIQCSIVGIGAEVHVCKAVAQMTGGTYTVARNEEHLKQLIFAHSPPPPSTQKTQTSLIRMGFPKQRTDEHPSLCLCHSAPKFGGYFCPQCLSKYCDLPTDCATCNLTLISSPHLARSYHHLFPVPAYDEGTSNQGNCGSCQRPFKKRENGKDDVCFRCPKCIMYFCMACDDYIHDSLHNCPGCEMKVKI